MLLNNMTETVDILQEADDKIGVKNCNTDSGIQIDPPDEEHEVEEKTADDNSEDNPIPNPRQKEISISSEEEKPINSPYKQYNFKITPSIEGKSMITPSIEDETIATPSKEDAKMEKITEEEKSDLKDTHNLVTVELAVKENHNSPEVVVEPKFVEILPIEKHVSQKIRVMTPKYFSLPHERNRASPALQVTKERSFCKKFKRCVLLILFTAVVVGYAIGGAFLFSYLERRREIEYNAKIDKWKNDTAILLATELRQVTPYEEVWARKVFYYLEIFEKDLLKASAVGYRRQDDKDREQRWTWASSLFFSVTLLTTTGYGSMTPRSKLGRIATFFYSMFGIPLTLSWFMVIGYTLATFWASLFQNVCCSLCHENPPQGVQDLFPNVKTMKPIKLQKRGSNSIVPIEEQKLIPLTGGRSRQSETLRQSMLPEVSHGKSAANNHCTKGTVGEYSSCDCSKCHLETEFAEMQYVYDKMDYAMAVIYASILFIMYYVISSILFALYEGWVLTDIFYFSYLMFVTVGPGCQELADNGAEIQIKNDLFYTIHLCIGYCILSMILNLIYLLFREKSVYEKGKKWEVSTSFHSEKF